MKALFVVIIKHRSMGTDAEVFDSPEDAIAYAKQVANSLCRDEAEFEERLSEGMIKKGWIYFCEYSWKDECVYVMKKVLNPALPKIEGN